MLLTVLVIGRRALREGLCEIVWRQQARLAHHREGLFGKVQQIAPIPVCHRQDHRARLFRHRQAALLEVFGALQQFLECRFVEPFQHQHLAAGKECTVQFKARILGRRPDQRHHTAFDERQEAVLLGPVEAVDFVNEEQRALAHLAARFGPVESRAKLFHAGEDRADCLEFQPRSLGQQAGDGGLSRSWRSPENDRGQPLGEQHPGQRAFRPDQVVLAHHLNQRFRAQPVSQRPGRAAREAS